MTAEVFNGRAGRDMILLPGFESNFFNFTPGLEGRGCSFFITSNYPSRTKR